MIKDKEPTLDVLKIIERNIEYHNVTINDIKETEDGLITNNKVNALHISEYSACVALARVYYSIKHSHSYANNKGMELDYVECEPCFVASKECNCLTGKNL